MFFYVFSAIFGAITMPKDFASYLLAIVIINLLMYFVFYIFMKVKPLFTEVYKKMKLLVYLKLLSC